jgi:hypothetical protein
VTRGLAFRPDALDAYRALRADRSGELGKRVKAALERLAADPGGARAESARWDSLEGKVWSLPVAAPDDSTWLVLWAEQPPDVIEVFYVGPGRGGHRRDVDLGEHLGARCQNIAQWHHGHARAPHPPLRGLRLPVHPGRPG